MKANRESHSPTVETLLAERDSASSSAEELLAKVSLHASPKSRGGGRFVVHVDPLRLKINRAYEDNLPTFIVRDRQNPGIAYLCNSVDMLGTTVMKHDNRGFSIGGDRELTSAWVEADDVLMHFARGESARGTDALSPKARGIHPSDLKNGCG